MGRAHEHDENDGRGNASGDNLRVKESTVPDKRAGALLPGPSSRTGKHYAIGDTVYLGIDDKETYTIKNISESYQDVLLTYTPLNSTTPETRFLVKEKFESLYYSNPKNFLVQTEQIDQIEQITQVEHPLANKNTAVLSESINDDFDDEVAAKSLRPDPNQLLLFADDEEASENIAYYEQVSDTDVDFALMQAASSFAGEEEVVNICMELTPELSADEDRIEALKRAFDINETPVTYPDSTSGRIKSDIKGITVIKGESIIVLNEKTFISWKQAYKKLTNLIETSRYGSEYFSPIIGHPATKTVEQPTLKQMNDSDIDFVLMRGSNFEGGIERIVRICASDASAQEKNNSLKKEYGTGGGTLSYPDGVSGYASYDSKGLKITKGNTILTSAEGTFLSWSQVRDRLTNLIETSRYGTEYYYPYITQSPDINKPIIETTLPEMLGIEQPEIPKEHSAPRKYLSKDELDSYFLQSGYRSTKSAFGGTFLSIYGGTKNNVSLTIKDNTLDFHSVAGNKSHTYEIRHFYLEADGTLAYDGSNDYAADMEKIKRARTAYLEEKDFDKKFWDTETLDKNKENTANIKNEEERSELESKKPAESSSVSETSLVSQKLNYRIPDEPYSHGGQKTRFQTNIAAIKTLKTIESEKRYATPDEQVTLSRYAGWGGIPQAFDPDNNQWSREYAELKELLSDDEYNSARASTLNAHYTSPTVIKAMYNAIGNMGFETGNVLEPAMGVGNFLGLIPENMQNSKLYGVELDSISGRISKQLYQNADIQVTGFEKTNFPEHFFDVAIGNVPFGDYKISDPKYSKSNFRIHDYFFAKSLDLVRPGGVIAFVTSQGTMDKSNPSVRKYLGQRAELMGAIRLPNDTFKDSAGTEVTTDIVFLRKRERMIDIEPDWAHLGKNENDIPLNAYFAEHPEMILGTMINENKLYGGEGTSCIPFKDKNLSDLLEEAIKNIKGKIIDYTVDSEFDKPKTEWIPADPNVRNWSYAVINNEIYYRENSGMEKQNMSQGDKERLMAMIEINDSVKAVINSQQGNFSPGDGIMKAEQQNLNALYDAFTKKYGLINNKQNAKVYNRDSAYYLLCALETLDEDGNFKNKADIFNKRTIRQYSVPDTVDTPTEALAISLSEKARVDIDYMSRLAGVNKEKIISDLRGVIFPNPEKYQSSDGAYIYETADEYLSGEVRRKLAVAKIHAAEKPEIFSNNVIALEEAQPTWLEAKDIDVRLGSTWIDRKYIQDFMYETFETPKGIRDHVQIEYSPLTADWGVTGGNLYSKNNILTTMTYGTKRINAYDILEKTLNLKDIKIFDNITNQNGEEKKQINQQETTLAQMKQEALKEKFRDWIFQDPERREHLVEKYNTLFNSTRPREYNGNHLVFPGMNPEIKLMEHQQNAIAHVIYGGNTLLAHEVGAGKTYEMVASIMENKRLGLCNKSLMVVPNHLTEQTASEFLRLYPAANILVTTKKDFETKNRKKFCARIATGEYDAIIIGHSQFEKIPLSQERQENFIQRQIWDIVDALKESGSRFTTKQLEKFKKRLEGTLQELADADRKDDVICFEELGVDRLYVDESQNYKNLFLYTKMANIAGIPCSDAIKSSDMFMKCRYMDKMTSNKGVVFATGTPISNSMTEMYTVMRYLQYDKLKDLSLEHFDAWASTFGETTTNIELSPQGTNYKARTRFAKFYNLPELMSVFKDVADIKTADTLNLPRPEATYHNIVAKPSEIQQALVQELSVRAAKITNREVQSTEDNMLVITSDGRKIGIDQRLMDTAYPDEPTSKVNICMENVYKIWDETKDKKLTQLIFCDFSTPGKDKFNVYDDIKEKLLQKGIPENEVAYIHDADDEKSKKELFAKVQNGSVRVLMGSTQKMGAGTNVQNKLIALHHLDCPWRPSDLTQREGRIIRQGNDNPEVHIYRYVTEATFDAYLWQTVENKQKFISQIMTSKSPARSCEDVDESVLSYAEVKALCAGNPLIREKMDLDVDVTKLKIAKSSHQNNIYALQDKLRKEYPNQIRFTESCIEGLEKDEAKSTLTRKSETFPGIDIVGRKYTEKEDAGKALTEFAKTVKTFTSDYIGNYRGFEMFVKYNDVKQSPEITLKCEMSHSTTLGESPLGNITRLNNALDGISDRISEQKNKLEDIHKQIKTAREEIGKTFPKEDELQKKLTRLNQINIELNIGNKVIENNEIINDSTENKTPIEIAEEILKTKREKQTITKTDLEDMRNQIAIICPDAAHPLRKLTRDIMTGLSCRPNDYIPDNKTIEKITQILQSTIEEKNQKNITEKSQNQISR
ncbi:hypothetical protein FACS1894187_11180 [Synergistales bacterium]|nr:hypothetical protein FACS1894187_11180 [Synergistales bacterium]